MTSYALITRPWEDAKKTARAFQKLGYLTYIEPMMHIEFFGRSITLDADSAVAITSSNGARALAKATSERDMKLFAVGDASAWVAADHGFTNVTSAGGDVSSLITTITKHCDPKDTSITHIAGSVQARDLRRMLEDEGYLVHREELYASKPAEQLSEGLQEMIRNGDIHVAPFYSPRTAKIFVELVQEAGLDAYISPISMLCLSRAVANKLEVLAPGECYIALHPSEASLISLAPPVKTR